jgi:hypothetical protein
LKSLSPAERNYHVHDLELLAIVNALKEWRHYVMYPEEKTKIYTDHKNLLYFMEKREFNARQVRWANFMKDFDYEIEYRSGAKNGGADALSRKDPEDPHKEGENFIQTRPIIDHIIGLAPVQGEPLPETQPDEDEFNDFVFDIDQNSENELFDFDQYFHDPTQHLEEFLIAEQENMTRRISEGQQQDPGLREIFDTLPENPEEYPDYNIVSNVLYYKGKLVVPNIGDIKLEVMLTCHDDPLAGHFGIQKTFELVSQNFYWDGMRSFIKKYVQTCDQCK